MPKYRKRPIIIEAIQYRDSMRVEDNLPEGVVIQYWDTPSFEEGDYPTINTLEGPHKVKDGDFIITGINGEKYPCKPDIFEKTYEAVNDEDLKN